MSPRQRIFVPLYRYLAALPPEVQELHVSLTEMEAVIGPSTRDGRTQWTGAGLARTISRYSPFTVHYSRAQQALTFVRKEP
jgi:hypothetical protein